MTAGDSHRRWVDSHCHLGWEGAADDADTTVARARAAGVEALVCVGTDLASSRRAVELADAAPRGAGDRRPAPPRRLPTRRASGTRWSRWRATAPTSWSGSARPASTSSTSTPDRAAQEAAFRAQIRARARARPRARDPLARRVGRHVPRPRRRRACRADGVPLLHRWSRRGASARSTLGAYLSFSGIVTSRTPTTCAPPPPSCPLDRVLVETDAPYLAPVPHRGRPNRARLGGRGRCGPRRRRRSPGRRGRRRHPPQRPRGVRAPPLTCDDRRPGRWIVAARGRVDYRDDFVS